MKCKALAAMVTVMVLAVLPATTVWAQSPIGDEFVESTLSEITVGQYEYCDASLGACIYVTYEDNEDNAGTGAPDNDMGDDGGGGYYTTCRSQAKHPIEFNVEISTVAYKVDAVLGFYLPQDTDPALIRTVYFNGTRLTNYYHETSSSGTFNVWVGRVDPSLVHVGSNLVGVILESGACVSIMAGELDMTDWVLWEEEEEFVPEPATVALLGTGLAGLAGYAGLRLRRRQ